MEKELYFYGMSHEEFDDLTKEGELYLQYEYCKFEIEFVEEELGEEELGT